MFRRQRKGGEQLYRYLDNESSHSACGKDLGIDVKAIQKAFNRFEQVDQCVVAVNRALDPR